MRPRKYFPLGKAYGEAFCNRTEETRWLVGNLKNVKHSLLIAPRRYGKSSLAEKAIAEANIPFIKINFHLCTTEDEVTQLIVNHVIKLIGKSIGNVEKIINSIKKYVSNLSPKLSFGEDFATLELVPKKNINQSLVITEALLLIEKLLDENNKKAVIFFDEFQEIGKIAQTGNIEGAIRTAAQEMQNLSIIFSGSIRTLLIQMFNDEQRPLYKLCRKLKLDRISAEDYQKHINIIAKETWGKSLDESTLNEIMTLSGRHPYYVNYLCDIIWENETYPDINDVQKAWSLLVEEEWSDALKEISILSLAQRKFLKFIAQHEVTALSSQETSLKTNMALSTIASTVEVLLEKDYIELDEATGQYKIINPVLISVLRDSSNE